MTLKTEWKIAKWLYRHGPTKRIDISKWFPCDMAGRYRFFRVYLVELDNIGNSLISSNDEFVMTDDDIDAYNAEKIRRIHELRNWIIPITSITAIIISVIALAISAASLLLQLLQWISLK